MDIHTSSIEFGMIFDMDGLLFDTERLYRESWLALAPQFGQKPEPGLPEAVCGVSGIRLKEIILSYYPDIDADAYIQSCTERVRQLLSTEVPLKPGVRELLSYLKAQKTKTAIASSSPLCLIRQNLALTGLDSFFDVIVSGEQVLHGKPAPDIFLEAAHQLGLPPESCYVFEDGIHGIQAAAAAGCRPVMVPDLTLPDAKTRALCTGIYPSLRDILEDIKSVSCMIRL